MISCYGGRSVPTFGWESNPDWFEICCCLDIILVAVKNSDISE